MSSTQELDDKINGVKPRDFDPIERKTENEQITDDKLSQEEDEERQETISREDKYQKESKEQAKDIGEKSEPTESINNEEIDEYGNKVEKEKLYTRQDVERMMRDRLSRGHNATPQQQAQVQQAADNFKADPNSSEDWETQLASFVRNEIDKVSREGQTKAYQEKERAKQSEFESKFTTSMERYKDFRETVGSLPITDSMMMATRDMKDPAAFLYAAAKMHPEDVKRIAGMDDAFQQAAEIGRLEERMKKARNLTRSAKPLEIHKSDVSAKYEPKKSIDAKIMQHAKAKRR